jgi:hyperosmotically inducible periplasmic protein
MKTRYLVLLTLANCVMLNQKEAEQASNAWLKTKILTNYALSEPLDPFTINVKVTSNLVTLTGTVQNDTEWYLAEEIAKTVKGDNKVTNKLDINPEA